MELFIRVKDGQPFEHPIFGDNFCNAFPNVDTNNLPAEFARFVRVAAPAVGPYEKNQTVSYQLVDGAYTDVFTVEQMTAEEIAAKQQAVKDAWAANGFASWVFNAATCSFNAPTPRPTDVGIYAWDEPSLSWVLTDIPPMSQQKYTSWTAHVTTGLFYPPVAYPVDGKNYKWDETTTLWVEVNNA
jgi:hypothetical protein